MLRASPAASRKQTSVEPEDSQTTISRADSSSVLPVFSRAIKGGGGEPQQAEFEYDFVPSKQPWWRCCCCPDPNYVSRKDKKIYDAVPCVLLLLNVRSRKVVYMNARARIFFSKFAGGDVRLDDLCQIDPDSRFPCFLQEVHLRFPGTAMHALLVAQLSCILSPRNRPAIMPNGSFSDVVPSERLAVANVGTSAFSV